MAPEFSAGLRGRTLLTFLFVLASTVPIGGDASAQPAVGNWEISSREEVANREVRFSGDITILAGGSLVLANSTLVMDSPPPREATITVRSGGTLILNGSAARPSVITVGELSRQPSPYPQGTGFYYTLLIEKGGIVQGHGCEIRYAGANQFKMTPTPVSPPMGFVVQGTLELDLCRYESTNYGIRSTDGTVRLRNVTSAGNHQAFNFRGGAVRIENSRFVGYWGIGGVDGFEIHNSTFDSSSGGRVGGTGPQGNFIPSKGTIRNSRFTNSATCLGIFHITVEIIESTFQNCGMAIEMSQGTRLLAHSLHVEGSRAVGAGGATQVHDGELTIYNGTISGSAGADIQTSSIGIKRDINLFNVTLSLINVPSNTAPDTSIRRFSLVEVRFNLSAGTPEDLMPRLVQKRTGQELTPSFYQGTAAFFWVKRTEHTRGEWLTAPSTWRVATEGKAEGSWPIVDMVAEHVIVQVEEPAGEDASKGLPSSIGLPFQIALVIVVVCRHLDARRR